MALNKVCDAQDADWPVADTEAVQEARRLLADQRFHASDRGRAFLLYLTERHCAGYRDGARAYELATTLLGRPSTFKGSLDPIVRIEMARLRAALETYYEAFGNEKPVRIELPRGNYALIFHKVGGQPSPLTRSEAPREEGPIPYAEEVPDHAGEFLDRVVVTVAALVVVLGVEWPPFHRTVG